MPPKGKDLIKLMEERDLEPRNTKRMAFPVLGTNLSTEESKTALRLSQTESTSRVAKQELKSRSSRWSDRPTQSAF